jgi:AcrR family transcriptional regulator
MGTEPANVDGESRRARTPSVEVEQALVDAAEVVLVRAGPSGVTVRAVAEEAGVAPMGIYNRFGGKDGLIEALLIRAFDGLRAAVGARGETDPTERLTESGRRYRAFALANPQHYTVMFGQARSGDVMTARVQQHAGAAFGELIAHIEYAMTSGVIAPGDAGDVAQQIWSSIHGAVALELNGLVKTADPGATYERLLGLLLSGLEVR